jgi:hypothetical protein
MTAVAVVMAVSDLEAAGQEALNDLQNTYDKMAARFPCGSSSCKS